MQFVAAPLHVTSDSCAWAAQFSRAGHDAGSVTAWPALLSPELRCPDVLEAIGPALTVDLHLSWRRSPTPGRYGVTVTPVEGPSPADRSYRTTVDQDGACVAQATTTFRLSRPAPSASPGRPVLDHRDNAPTARWGRTITEDEVREYCAALGVPLAAGELFDWSGLSPIPQPVLPASFLAAEGLRVLGAPRAGHLQLRLRRPCIAGAALEWSRSDSPAEIRLSVRAVGAPAESWSARFWTESSTTSGTSASPSPS